MKLSERIKRLSSVYQGMDDQDAIAREAEALEAKCAELQSRLSDAHKERDLFKQDWVKAWAKVTWQASMLERARLVMTHHTPDYDQRDWLSDLEKGPQ